MVFGSSQARGPIGAAAASLCNSHSNARSELSLWPMLQFGSTRSLTHWVRPGIQPASSWILVVFLTHWATIGTPKSCWFLSESRSFPLAQWVRTPTAVAWVATEVRFPSLPWCSGLKEPALPQLWHRLAAVAWIQSLTHELHILWVWPLKKKLSESRTLFYVIIE